MTEDNNRHSANAIPGRISQIEGDLGSLKGEVGSLKTEFKVLGNTVKGLSDDIAASDRKQDAFHAEWRNQKDAERREADQLARSRQLGPLQFIQLAAACATFLAVAFGGFFFLIRAYVDGTLTPQITQLTERQNATSQSAVGRNEIIDNIRAQLAEQGAGLAETTRVANDNRTRLLVYGDRIRALEIEAARREERQQANEKIRDIQDAAEKEMRMMADTALRDELRSFKARAVPP